ncbi:DUF3047 domain-containing protein [Pelagibius sp. Alg239-R121]|uniref:DUF3047 domain-containing protein n=1 Tax=Pelagibius sp. Alg239-R121 TaxID=2993448 RepID=UPI0024A7445C|nr:DUF3047 domain-containing protein [Pelagibius sp. Alg239-R121]
MFVKPTGKTAFFGSLAVVAFGGLAFAAYSILSDPFDTGKPLTAPAENASQILLVDGDFQIDPLADGWAHRTFFGVTPTSYSIETVEERRVLQCKTNNSGSILARHTRIDVSAFPILSWAWKVVRPIEKNIDENTKEGDDHPARFFLKFEDDGGKARAAEIIWSNKKYAPGEFKIIGDFYHYVANGLPGNTGVWHDQRVDLLQLYKDIGGQEAAPHLTVLGFFCDSDNTGGESLAYFDKITLSSR